MSSHALGGVWILDVNALKRAYKGTAFPCERGAAVEQPRKPVAKRIPREAPKLDSEH